MFPLFGFIVSGELFTQIASNGKLYTRRYSTQPKTKPVLLILNTSRPRQNSRHFTDDIFKLIFLCETFDFQKYNFIEIYALESYLE